MAIAASKPVAWLVGFWAQIVDEDGRPLDDTIEFRGNGTAVHYSPACEVVATTNYHVKGHMVFVTAQVRKGFISVVYVPNEAHTQLTMTSPRTANNALYERRHARCVPVDV